MFGAFYFGQSYFAQAGSESVEPIELDEVTATYQVAGTIIANVQTTAAAVATSQSDGEIDAEWG